MRLPKILLPTKSTIQTTQQTFISLIKGSPSFMQIGHNKDTMKRT
jgi:hypothetical protein